MIKNPETYEELLRFKKCVDLTKYYELSEEEIEKIYNFLASTPGAFVIGNKNCLSLIPDGAPANEIINANCIDPNIDGVKLSDALFSIIPHYEPTRFHDRGGFGRSSNNNNNNNNTTTITIIITGKIFIKYLNYYFGILIYYYPVRDIPPYYIIKQYVFSVYVNHPCISW